MVFYLFTKKYLYFYFKLFDLLQTFTGECGDTSKSHKTKSVEIFEKYLKTFATEIFEILKKDLTSF